MQIKFAIENEKDEYIYARGNNLTMNRLCPKIVVLIGGEDCMIVGIGAAAISNALVSQVNAGEQIESVQYIWAAYLMVKIYQDFTYKPILSTTHNDIIELAM
ncbi:MAG: PLP-dependent transferase [Emticicia sp.]|uniref:PLP-dependent transferase n=1 Tax=Emticicia sp. TaxID=1930953 RepID=UPI003BA4B632